MMTSNQRGIAGIQDLEVKLKHVDPQLRARLVAGSVERVDFLDFIGCRPSIFSSKRASALGRSWPGSSLS
jgi:uncharacterized membrane protein (DUF441 family)